MARLANNLANATLAKLMAQFARTGAPQHVSFRELLRAPSLRDRATHDLHPYPARLLVNIPSFFLSTSLSASAETVLDPFCGSGTVLLEAVLAERNAIGADANPLARLITRTKLATIDLFALKRARRSLFARIPPAPTRDYPNVVNLDYWFLPHVSRDLLRLLSAIEQIRNEGIRDFFSVAFSACIKDVSLADPRLSVPVRLRKDQYPRTHWLHRRTNERLARLRTIDVLEVFSNRLDDNIRRVEHMEATPNRGRCLGIGSDARALNHVETDSVDLVITSPPYVGAQKYVRASSLSLTWLELCGAKGLRALEDVNIGREHHPRRAYQDLIKTGLPNADLLLSDVRKLNPLRAHIAASYLCEMREAIREVHRVLKPSRHLVLIAGESRILGFQFPTPQFLVQMAQQAGFTVCLNLVDTIRSRALMTKRHHTAGRIDTESILLLQKDA